MNTYTYEQDSAHAWLGVPLAELIELGLAERISGYSYLDVRHNIVWLEEDKDMKLFILARAKEAGVLGNSENVSCWITAFFAHNVVSQHVHTSRVRHLLNYRTAIALLPEESAG